MKLAVASRINQSSPPRLLIMKPLTKKRRLVKKMVMVMNATEMAMRAPA